MGSKDNTTFPPNNHPIRTIPPYVRQHDDEECGPPSPIKQPKSRYAVFITEPVRKFTSEEDRAYATKRAAEESRIAAQLACRSEKKAANLSFKERAARCFKETDRILRHSTWWLLIIRLAVVMFSASCLGLAGSIYVKVSGSQCNVSSSTYLALVINTAAMPYTGILIFDEMTNRPINERPFQVRLLLAMADVLAISFNAANLGVAFEALTDSGWVCQGNSNCTLDPAACRLQKALVVMMVVIQIAWIAALYTAIYRIAGRLRPLY